MSSPAGKAAPTEDEQDAFDSEQTQRAMLNILDDFAEERKKLEDIQKAVLNMLDDINDERLKAEAATASVAAANKELEAFTYSVSHDLRAPLRAISGFSQALSEDEAPLLDGEGKRYLGLIQSNVGRMGQLIDDLLAFSRLGRQQITIRPLDVDGMARSVMEELLVFEKDRKIDVTFGEVPDAEGDQTLVREVLINLFSNAMKFTKKRETAKIEFGFDPKMRGGAYFVRDNGVGFDMRYVGKLFGVFQRLHSTTEFEGTGVGLALVQRIVVRHGGSVWAIGEIDKGATFYFTLSRTEESR